MKTWNLVRSYGPYEEPAKWILTAADKINPFVLILDTIVNNKPVSYLCCSRFGCYVFMRPLHWLMNVTGNFIYKKEVRVTVSDQEALALSPKWVAEVLAREAEEDSESYD